MFGDSIMGIQWLSLACMLRIAVLFDISQGHSTKPVSVPLLTQETGGIYLEVCKL